MQSKNTQRMLAFYCVFFIACIGGLELNEQLCCECQREDACT